MSAGALAEHAFLGEEFLTWVWYQWETEGGEFRLPGERIVGVALDDLLTFAPAREGDTEQTLRKGLPTRTPEARVALRGGRRLRKARLIVAEGQRQWTFTLDAATMTLSGVRLPEDDEEAESDQERSENRVAEWLGVQEIVGELYGMFLRKRLRLDYLEHGAAQQAQWMTR